MDAYHVDSLSSYARCSNVFEEIAEGNVLGEGGFIFQVNHPLFFHAGEDEFLSQALEVWMAAWRSSFQDHVFLGVGGRCFFCCP